MLAVGVHPLRQRRRQQWHARRTLRPEKRKFRKGDRKTIDGGAFPVPLRDVRRGIPISDKLKVLELYDNLKTQKRKAQEELTEPRPRGATKDQLKEFHARKKKLIEITRKSIQKECKKQFPQIVGNCQVWKWKKRSEQESWSQLPEVYRTRKSATNNSWRKKIGVLAKGRRRGSHVPLQLQKELDILMMELSSGLSDVSSRKEIIDVETLAPNLHSVPRCQTNNMKRH